MSHPCPRLGCGKRVPDSMLACRSDWYRVSASTRQDVLVTWPDFLNNPEPYLEARAQAVKEMNRP